DGPIVIMQRHGKGPMGNRELAQSGIKGLTQYEGAPLSRTFKEEVCRCGDALLAQDGGASVGPNCRCGARVSGRRTSGQRAAGLCQLAGIPNIVLIGEGDEI